MEKIIRIEAKCKMFEIDKQVTEKKSLTELTRIRSNFINYALPRRSEDKLTVKTSVINPKLF